MALHFAFPCKHRNWLWAPGVGLQRTNEAQHRRVKYAPCLHGFAHSWRTRWPKPALPRNSCACPLPHAQTPPANQP
eukprot:7386865-Lingulodinium_polyedra.AAC.1